MEKQVEGTVIDYKNTVQQQEKTEQQIAQEFVQKYQKLCEEYGFQIVITPAFRARDDGTWSVILQSSIGKLSKKE